MEPLSPPAWLPVFGALGVAVPAAFALALSLTVLALSTANRRSRAGRSTGLTRVEECLWVAWPAVVSLLMLAWIGWSWPAVR